jgi:hypothetical protein
VSTNKNELLDQYELCLKRLFSAVIEASEKRVAFLTAIGKGGSGAPEIRESFGRSSDLQHLQLQKDAARKAFDESGPHQGEITPRAEDLLKTDKLLDAAIAEISIGPPVNVGIAVANACDQDTSQTAIDDLIGSLFNVKIANFRIESRTGEPREGLARHHGRLAAFKLLQDVFDRIDTYSGKGPAYYATAVRNGQKRLSRDFEIEDRNYLGGTPKESRHLSDDDRELIRAANRMAAEIDDPATAAAISDSENPEEIVLAQEEERRMEAKLDQLSGQLSSDQRALLKAWGAGESPTDARRRLGLSKSTENALRNKILRLRRQKAS